MEVFFGQNVRRLRLESDLTQKELAQRVGVWQTYISQIEQGVTPSMEIAVRIAQVLGVTLDELFVEPTDTLTPA